MDVDHLDDLLARIAMQDRRALRSLYEGTVARLLAVASRLLDDRASAEDVVQDMFITVWTRACAVARIAQPPDGLADGHGAQPLDRRIAAQTPGSANAMAWQRW